MNTRLLLACALLPVWGACSRNAPSPEPIRAVKLVRVQAAVDGVAQGWAAEVRARHEARLSFRIGGLLTQRQIELGQRFQAGQVLAELDPQDPGLGRQAAQAQVAVAQSQRDLALADLRRYEALFKQGFIGQAEWERRQSAWQTAQAQLEQARAQYELQANQARYTQLKPDRSGVVTGIEAEPGQVLAAGSPVLRVAWDGPREVQTWVAEDQVSQWKVGQSVQVARWGEEKPLTARVREVSASADPQTRSFLVRIDLPAQADWALGQTARVWAHGHSAPPSAWALFHRQQLLFARQPSGIAGEPPVGSHHPMARHQQKPGVATHGSPHRSSRLGATQGAGDVGITADVPARDAADLGPDLALKGGAQSGMQGQIQGGG